MDAEAENALLAHMCAILSVLSLYGSKRVLGLSALSVQHVHNYCLLNISFLSKLLRST